MRGAPIRHVGGGVDEGDDLRADHFADAVEVIERHLGAGARWRGSGSEQAIAGYRAGRSGKSVGGEGGRV